MPLFGLQKWIELGYVSQVANFWLSSHNFGEVAVIQKFQYSQNYKESFVWGSHATSSNMAISNYSYFAKIMPKIGNLTKTSWSQKITVCVHPFFHHTRHSWNHAPYRKCDFTKKIYNPMGGGRGEGACRVFRTSSKSFKRGPRKNIISKQQGWRNWNVPIYL